MDWLPNLDGLNAVLRLVLLALLMAVMTELAHGGLAGFDIPAFTACALVYCWLVVLAAGGIHLARPRLLALGTPLAVLACMFWINTLILTKISFQAEIDMLLGAPNAVMGALDQILLGNMVALIMLRYLYLAGQIKARERALRRASLDTLQARMRPHFLFNSLNGIIELIPTDARRAEEAMLELTELLRATLDDEAALVPLERELALCRKYLAMEQMRMGERLQVQWQLAPGLERVPVPLLLLQPLLENAIVHAIARREQGGTLQCSLHLRDDYLHIEVRNPLGDDEAPPAHGAGHGEALANTRARLEAHYGDRYSLDCAPGDGEFRSRIRVPASGHD